jgi:thiol-disulfide isomerase/thioredoxin
MSTSRARWIGPWCLLALTAAAAWAAEGSPRDTSEQEIQAQLERGHQALGRRDLREALAAYRKADRLAGGRSAEALDGLGAVYEKTGKLDDCIQADRRAVEVAATPQLKARFSNHLGRALFEKWQRTRDPRDRKTLDECVASFRSAVDLGGNAANGARYNLGVALLAQSHDEEGVAVLRAYLAAAPEPAEAEHARQLITDPRRARENFAPDFSVTTLDGKPFSLVDLKGRVALLDFWATWCAPCRQSVPSLKKLAETMKTEPFVVLGISEDADEATLRSYLARETESWPQHLDVSGRLMKEFGARALPTFVLLDGDGRIVYAVDGWGSSRERQLRTAVSRAVAQLKESKPGPH